MSDPAAPARDGVAAAGVGHGVAAARVGGGMAAACMVAALAVAAASAATAPPAPDHGGAAAPAAAALAPGPRPSTAPRFTRDRPPAAHTGGFGEPTCAACHTDMDADAGPGTLRVEGLPAAGYVPGQVYDLVLLLEDPQLRAAGFQIAFRFEDGRQAGQPAAGPGEEGRVDVTLADDVVYTHHLYDGTTHPARGTARWAIRWTAPAHGGTVHINTAAVAADDDLSNLGDLVYTARLALPSRTVK